MKSNLQLHALPSELQKLVQKFIETHPSLYHYPFYRLDGTLYAIAFSNDASTTNFTTPYKFLGSYPEALIIDIGRMSKDELRQSAISFIADDDATIKRWQTFIKLVKNNSKTGLRAISVDGTKGRVSRLFRITQGAYSFYLNGGKLLAFAGTVTHIPSEIKDYKEQ